MSMPLRVAALIVLVLPILGASGCTGSNPLSAGNGSVIVQVELINTTSRFDFASMRISQITCLPVNPDSSAALGSRSLSLIPAAIEIDDLNIPASFQFEAPLTAGVYTLSYVAVTQLELFDLGPTADDPCSESVDFYRLPGNTNPRLTTFAGVNSISIDTDRSTTVTLVLDVQKLIEVFQSSWSQACWQTNCFSTAWCLRPGVAWNQSEFTNRASEYLCIEADPAPGEECPR